MYQTPVPPANETERLKFLSFCDILDTPKDEKFDRLTRLATRFYDADIAFIGFIDSDYQWMKSITADGVPQSVARNKSVCNIMITTGEPLVIGDLRTDPRLQGHPLAAHLPLRFYAGAPLLNEAGLAIGSMCIMKREPQDARSFDLASLTDFAAIAMSEVELWRQNRELARLSEVDALTGIANRRSFDAAIERALQRAHRTGEPVAALLLDLDHFKGLNDHFGHQKGDEVLRLFGQVLSENTRSADDTVARYGGEEFAIVLPNADEDGAVRVAHDVQNALRAAALAHPTTSSGLVTASIGIATFERGSALDARALVARADAALYGAKRSGRDQFQIHNSV